MQRIVTKIEKSFTNSNHWPVSWLELDCGHTAKAQLRDPRNDTYRNEHDDAHHIALPGSAVECDRCDHYQSQLARLRAMPAGSAAHSRFRHRDSRGFGAGDHYLYVRDPKSPSGVHLELSIEDTPEAVAELRRVTGTSSLSPTEKR